MPNQLLNLPHVGAGPSAGFVNVAPADADLADELRYLRVGVAGTLRLTGLNGTVINLTVVEGEIVPGWIRRVHASGTTATGLVGYL